MAIKISKAGTTPQRPPLQWEIWQVNQAASRAATNPPTPPDPYKIERPFIIISPNSYNSGGQEVVCLPISGEQFVKTFEVELTPKLVGGLTKISYVKCFKPVTIDVKYLKEFRGNLSDPSKISEIKETLKDFLEL
jgi:mRNA-degrading endonuclease toxin of MazEF toxin-antitoxin module